jgi:hypothetical protein
MYFVYQNFNKTIGTYERKNARGNKTFNVNCNWEGEL